MKKQTIIILAISFFLVLVFGALFIEAYISHHRYKKLYSYTKEDAARVSKELTELKHDNSSLLKLKTELTDNKKNLSGKNEYLRYLNKNLNKKLKNYNRKFAGKKKK